MHIKVIRSYLEYFLLFSKCHRLLWTTKPRSTARFDLHKDQFASMLGYKIDFPIPAAKITLQDGISLAYQCLTCHTFTRTSQTLARTLLLLILSRYRACP